MVGPAGGGELMFGAVLRGLAEHSASLARLTSWPEVLFQMQLLPPHRAETWEDLGEGNQGQGGGSFQHSSDPTV